MEVEPDAFAVLRHLVEEVELDRACGGRLQRRGTSLLCDTSAITGIGIRYIFFLSTVLGTLSQNRNPFRY